MRIILALAVAALAGCTAAAPEPRLTQPGRDSATVLQGRSAGPPQACVSLRGLHNVRVAEGGLILAEGAGDIVYANRPPAGCSGGPDAVLVTRTFEGRLCRGDIVDIFQPGGTVRGSCSLGDFVPYPRRRD